MKVRGAVFEAVGHPLAIETLEMTDIPGPGQVLVRYRASGVCHTDLSFTRDRNRKPEVLGHEGAGTIEAIGDGVDELEVGDTVIASFRASCGVCFYCLRGQNPHCEWGGGPDRTKLRELRYKRPNGSMVHSDLGTFSEAAILPSQFVVKVETTLPFEQLALIGCGITTGFGAAVNTAGVTAGSTVAIIGCGGVGQAAIQGARIAGASRIIAIDTVQSKLDFARQQGATDEILVTRSVDIVAIVRSLTEGRGVDYALEITGMSENVMHAYDMVRRRGTVVAVGINASTVEIPIHDMILNEKRLLGSLYGSAQTPIEFPRIARLAESGLINLESMVSNIIDISEINDAMSAMESGKVIRSVISFS